MFARVTASSVTRSAPTVLTIVASTSAVAATLTIVCGVLGAVAPPTFGSAASACWAQPSTPRVPSAAPAPATS